MFPMTKFKVSALVQTSFTPGVLLFHACPSMGQLSMRTSPFDVKMSGLPVAQSKVSSINGNNSLLCLTGICTFKPLLEPVPTSNISASRSPPIMGSAVKL